MPQAEVDGLAPAPGTCRRRPPLVALAPGAVGPSKRWPAAYYAELARRLTAEGTRVWVIGGPGERALAAEIVRSRRRHPRSHRPRPAQRHPGARRRRCRGVERFRPAACRGRARHADGRDFRTDQPVALGAAQSDRRGHRDRERRSLPALPQAGLPLGHHRCMRDISVDQVAAATRDALALLTAAREVS